MLFYLSQDWDNGRVKVEKSAAAKSQVQSGKTSTQIFDEKEILRISQAAIGNQIGDYAFLDRSGRTVRISDYRGKPLVISMIYTHCPIICATTTRSLTALKLSQSAFGVDSFGVLTIGFDTENDTPEAMDMFAQRMEVDLKNWDFVSSDAETIKKISKDLGFTFFQNDEGVFNHITQTTFVDAQGKVYRQIYGEEFPNKTLLEPIRDMIYNIKTAESGLAGVANKVKLFCTVYDPKTGKYVVNYNEILGFGWGIFVSLLVIWWIVIEYRRSPKREHPVHD
ncbi:MAG: SCO family protein [Sideroxyarcus sp.]|nr:SCO family protein [Sideroxyarcus sp.]